MEDFASRLKELRESKKLTQEGLARKIDVSLAAIRQWETRKRMPTAPYIILIADYFNTSTDYLLGRKDY